MIGKDGVPTLRMEVIADMDLRIWYPSFGLPVVMNDLKILSVSPHFGKIFCGEYPAFEVKYTICGEEFTWLYYLADGIYPEYKIFAKTIGTPTTRKHKVYSAIPEGARNSVARVFRVLFKQFAIMFLPGRLWFSEDMAVIAKECCILHNMTVEERKEGFVGDGIGGIRSANIEPDESFNLVPLDAGLLGLQNRGSFSATSEEEHYRLKETLVENIWQNHGLVHELL